MQLARCRFLNTLRGAQCRNLQLQVAIQFFFGCAFLLQPLHQVAVTHELEVLPRRKEQHRYEQRADADGAKQLPLPRLVDLAHDRVVAHVFLDGVFEVGRAHASLSIARNLALRARGLRATSSSPASIGRLVRIRIAVLRRARAHGTCA